MHPRFIFLILLLSFFCYSQENSNYKVRILAFYNVENLFDTENDSLTFDDDYIPNGKNKWTLERYGHKINRIAKVLSEIGSEINMAPDIIGLCEVENRRVIEDLIHSPCLQNKNYGIIHFDSPDQRGIDVALLYKKDSFLPVSFASHRLLLLNDEGERNYTRDQLVVGGFLDGENFHFIVNHWPSRSGGEARSKPYRLAAAQLNRHIIDSIVRLDAMSKIVSMGDFNDDPTSDSLKKTLKTVGKKQGMGNGGLFNPMEKLYRKGMGSLAYRDKWNLFDQIFFTGNLVNGGMGQYLFWKAGIFAPAYLVSGSGPYKGYPFRTYAGGTYTGGYSDHFPVYAYFIKKAEK